MLLRDTNNAWVGGVAAGISNAYFIPVALVRLFFVVMFFAFGIGLALYALLWVIAEANDNQIRMNFS
jgi:phage shock protein PspC (stress-responsive transcriptional regulator)